MAFLRCALVSLAVSVTACSHGVKSAPDAALPSKALRPVAKAKKAADKTLERTAKRASRRVGDYFVYQFGGTFSETPLSLTEQVVAEDEGAFVIDFSLEEGEKTTALRVRFSSDDESRVLSVEKLGESAATLATAADYEALVERTQLVPESNDDVVGSSRTTCLVGLSELDCDVTTYTVTVDGRPALFSVSRSSKIRRDVGGEISRADGTVLYSARLVEHGNEPPKADAVARAGERAR